MAIHKFFPLAFLALCACGAKTETPSQQILVSVYGQSLSAQVLNAAVPSGLSQADSALFADQYIRQWVNEQLLLSVAEKNVVHTQSIQKQVEDYRRNLLINDYIDELLQQRVSDVVSKERMLAFYEQHKGVFVLKQPIVRGIYLKLPADAPNLDELQQELTKIDEQTLEKIEKYSLQNALVYEYFLDRWVDFDEVLQSIPYEVVDANSFLNKNKTIEVTNHGFWYFLYIEDFVLAGGIEPYDYAERQIKQLILNDERARFLHELESTLYKEAQEKKEITYYDNLFLDSIESNTK